MIITILHKLYRSLTINFGDKLPLPLDFEYSPVGRNDSQQN